MECIKLKTLTTKKNLAHQKMPTYRTQRFCA
jgi:hypothetical protein